MAAGCWWYYFSKFTEFFDTFFFVMRKRYDQVSTLHVIHHGIMPVSVWWGVKFTPGKFPIKFNFYFILIMCLHLNRRSQFILWLPQHLCPHHHVLVLHVGCHGTTYAKIFVVEEILDCLANGPVRISHDSLIPVVRLERVQLSNRIRLLHWCTCTYVLLLVRKLLQINIQTRQEGEDIEIINTS